MQKKARKISRRAFFVIYFYLVVILFSVLTVSTYTWFSINRSPKVSNISLYVTAQSGLEFSKELNSEDWSSQIMYSDLVKETPTLRPVTWSDREQRFYAARYGANGKLSGYWEPLSDNINANKNNYLGYYCVGTFYARTDKHVDVSLTPAYEIDGGQSGTGTYVVGVPVWDPDQIYHFDGGADAEDAIRIGIRITKLDEEGEPDSENSVFYIYEPNCDSHQLDDALSAKNGDYVLTPSIDGTETLVPTDRLITQTATSWIEASPVEKDVQIYQFGEFTSSTDLFSLEQNEKAMIQIYIWLEGQDIDCNNSLEESLIIASVQFLAKSQQQPGTVPIPLD